MFWLNADAGIGDGKLDHIVQTLGTDGDGVAGAGEGKRIGQQIDHDLLDAFFVGADGA